MSFSGLPGRGTLQSWGVGTVVAPSEFFWFENCIINALDGGAGGAYAPSAAIVLGGAGLQTTGPLAAGATSSVTMTAGTGQFTCGKTTVFNGGVTLNSSVVVNGLFTFGTEATVVADCGLIINGGLAINGTLEVPADIRSPLHFGQGGYIRKRRLRITSGGAGQTVSLEHHDVVFDTIAGDLILADYGGDGAVLHIVNESANNVIAKKEGTLEILAQITTLTWIKLMRDPTVAVGWRICERGSL